jgi:hypothetical protein
VRESAVTRGLTERRSATSSNPAVASTTGGGKVRRLQPGWFVDLGARVVEEARDEPVDLAGLRSRLAANLLSNATRYNVTGGRLVGAMFVCPTIVRPPGPGA